MTPRVACEVKNVRRTIAQDLPSYPYELLNSAVSRSSKRMGEQVSQAIRARLVDNLNPEQETAVTHTARLLGVVAGAGSGKTEVMARRVAWWIGIDKVDRSEIVAFTFTEAAAEELKFRIRERIGWVTEPDVEPSLSGMYVGTIHAFCLKCLREFAAAEYYNFDVLDDVGRMALVQRGFWNLLGLAAFEKAAKSAGLTSGRFDTIDLFFRSYDILNEHVALTFRGAERPAPPRVESEAEWCELMSCGTNLGTGDLAQAFAHSAARYYAFQRARRFLDFSTAQAEFVRLLRTDTAFRERVLGTFRRLVIDEVQDINPAQMAIIDAVIASGGHVTAVGDHRQAIYSFRGGRVDLMGELFTRMENASDGALQPLPANYRSTPRIVDIANRWAATIRDTAGMASPPMVTGKADRHDFAPEHVSLQSFTSRDEEADWIADTIANLVPDGQPAQGARHGEAPKERGLALADIAILVRSSTDITTYQAALQQRGIAAVVRGGADLFSRPEVILFLSALLLLSGSEDFLGGARNNSMPSRILAVLNTGPRHEDVIPAALDRLRGDGFRIPLDAAQSLFNLCQLINLRLTLDDTIPQAGIEYVASQRARDWLKSRRKPRRVFPQMIFQWLLEEVRFGDWGDVGDRSYEALRFHVGQLSFQLKGIESSGWTGADRNLMFQLIGFIMWGISGARIPEAPLLVPPDAVTVTTIHSAKGLEFGAVFVSDVKFARFPSNMARRLPTYAFDTSLVPGFSPANLADNANFDNERRLMYVALTRAERFLFVTTSAGKRTSQFIPELAQIFPSAGAFTGPLGPDLRGTIEMRPRSEADRIRLATSFSDLRYFIECPQDFYMRKVLGFTPPIGQEFGYGRGVHNLLRSVHENSTEWAALAGDSAGLRAKVEQLVDEGLFYLRHTVGKPYDRLKNKAVAGVIEYVKSYADELNRLEFEPEKPFETLFPEEKVLVTGAIDVVRLDAPPRVTLIDFKSGRSEGSASGLSEQMMAMQLGIYGVAAKGEMEFEPDLGLVRYIGERDASKREMPVQLSEGALAQVRKDVVATAAAIRARAFDSGPGEGGDERCGRCDFGTLCAMSHARGRRQRSA